MTEMQIHDKVHQIIGLEKVKRLHFLMAQLRDNSDPEYKRLSEEYNDTFDAVACGNDCKQDALFNLG